MGNKSDQGGFFKGLIREAVAYFRGYETEVTEERMRFRVRKIGLGIQGFSNVAQNVGFRMGKVRTSFGFASLGFTRGDSGKQRCFGLIPSLDKLHFYASFCSNTPTAAITLAGLLTMGLTSMDTHIPQNLMSSGILNQRVYEADGASFNYMAGSAVKAPATQIPTTPTANANSTTIFTLEGVNSIGVDRVQKFNSTGTFELTWGTTGTGTSQFTSPAAICTDISGAVYVLDQVNLRILKFDSLGNYLLTITLPSTIGTYSASDGFHLGMATDLIGNIWIVSQKVNSLFQFSSTGTLINQFGSSGSGNGQFNTPTGVCVDANGNVWVTDTNNNRIQQFSSAGVYLSQNTLAGTAPLGICADNASSVYVVGGSATGKSYQININTKTLTNTITLGSSVEFPQYITTDNVNLYIANNGTGSSQQVSSYTIAGSFNSSWGSEGTSTGQFEILAGIVAVVSNAAAPPPAGFLNGAYLYVATFSDANGNATGAGAPIQVTMAYQQAVINVSSTGFDTGTTAGWTTVNLYRTQGVFTSIPPITTAIGSQIFYLVGSKTLTGAGTYQFTDNISDLGSQGGVTTKAILTTNQPVTISAANFVILFENRIYAVGVTDNTDNFGNVTGSQVYHPTRIRWCELANGGSWPPLNFNDFNPGDNLPLIGAWAADRMIYAFKESFTFEMTPTGQNDPPANGVVEATGQGIPYSYVQTSHAYGFFHHSIADIGGTIVGRTRDGLTTYNGSKFSPISYTLSALMQRCITPSGDSGAFDPTFKKYYIAVCDSSLVGTYGAPMQSSGTNFLLQNAWRNTTIVWDADENTFELHPYCFNQVYKTMFDSYGHPQTYYGGVCSEVGIITGENQFGGVSYPGIGTIKTGNVVQDTTYASGGNAAGFVGKQIVIPYFWDTTTSTLNFLNFTSYVTAAANVSGTLSLTLNDPIPIIIGSKVAYCVDNATGLSDTGSTGSQLSAGVTNEFIAAGVAGSSYVYNDNTTYINSPVFNQLNDATNGVTVSATNTISSSGPGATGLQYVFLPYRFFQNPAFNELIPWEPRRLYQTPPYGLDQENVQKSFRFLELIARGTATILIRVYLYGNPNYGSTTYVQKLVKTINVQGTDLQKIFINLGGYTGTFIRVEIGTIRGNDIWEMQSIAVWFRQLGSLRAQ